jgi:hypothetical protein
MVQRNGLTNVGFVTLTFKENLRDRDEAQRRFNSFATNFLRRELEEFVVTVERQARGALHYHLVAAFADDIRSGFDFEACAESNRCRDAGDTEGKAVWARRYYASANQFLRGWWKAVRDSASAYGFGRCETLPVLSCAAGLARYVGGYVGSEWLNRRSEDRGLRTIRYSLKHRAASVCWAWVADNGATWRLGLGVLGALLNVGGIHWERSIPGDESSPLVQTEGFTALLGKRWAWSWRNEISVFGRHATACLNWISREVSDETDFADRVACASELAEELLAHEKRKEAECKQ